MADLDLLTATQAAEVYAAERGKAVKPHTISGWCRAGLIDVARQELISGRAHWLIPRAALLAYTPPPEGWKPGRARKTKDEG